MKLSHMYVLHTVEIMKRTPDMSFTEIFLLNKFQFFPQVLILPITVVGQVDSERSISVLYSDELHSAVLCCGP
jgi:hypothetical protein